MMLLSRSVERGNVKEGGTTAAAVPSQKDYNLKAMPILPALFSDSKS
jgi:hypothetical protein